ncbi:hypothetical protein [Parendozoicomonas haliclonae]|uniref:Uncharacterized protein n=1 Tax=Parendozoicomonas haliclonae TaxID=1960125 RepID=A0A1X7AIX2_9GAMM|nr:hypothetical protein [Parendozoicomonas haliclonae]SMA44390.1 hypothetical protein EHSB41UT_01791 [Parendozoicomonas haliclonae]
MHTATKSPQNKIAVAITPAFIILCLLIFMANSNAMAMSQASATFTVTLIIPPRVQLHSVPTAINHQPSPLRMSGTGIDSVSVSMMPDRDTRKMPAAAPYLTYGDGRSISLCKAPRINLAKKNCTHDLSMKDRTASGDITVLIASE